MSLFGEVPGLRFFTGFPRAVYGVEKAFTFRVRLEDGSFRDAYAHLPDGVTHRWVEVGTEEDLTDRVEVWRETYTCADAVKAISDCAAFHDRMTREIGQLEFSPLTYGLVTAFRRHLFLECEINGEPACQKCFKFWCTMCPGAVLPDVTAISR